MKSEPRAPIVEDEQLGPLEAFQHPGVPAVSAGDGECLEQLRHPVINDASAVPASLVAERTGDPALSETGWPGDEQVLVPADPGAVDEVSHHGAVDAARGAQVEIFHTVAELGPEV